MENRELQFRIAEIDVRTQTTDEKIVGIFRFESVGTSKHGPILLIIAEIHSTLYVYERLLDVINSTAEQARHLFAVVGQDPVGRFEKLVQRLNDAIADFSTQEASPLSWNRINLYVLELSEGHLCFSGVGSLMNIFLQKQIAGDFRAFDMLGSMDQTLPTDPNKPFASLICGDIHAGDVLFVGTTNFDHVRGELRIKDRIATLPPVTAALEIKQGLDQRHVPDHFVGVVIHCLEIKPVISTATVLTEDLTERSTTSITKLRGIEEEAQQHLAHVLVPGANLSRTRLKQWSVNLWLCVRTNLYDLLRRAQKPERVRDAIALTSLRGLSAGYGSLFTRQRKIKFVTIGALLTACVVGVALWHWVKNRAAENVIWNATFERVLDERNRAESDAIYGNDARAQKALDSAERSLSALPNNTSVRHTRVTKLVRELNEIKERLKKVVKTEQVTELVTLSPTAPEGSLLAPILTPETAYAVDNAAGAWLKISLNTKELKRIPLPKEVGLVVSVTAGKNLIILASANGKLFAFNKSDDSFQAMTWTHVKSSSTADIVLYASKLYSLDPTRSQVWRYQKSGSGFDRQTAYIKAPSVVLHNAVALAVDSSVYILKRDGIILRFLSGVVENFALSQTNPPLRSASGLWTELDSKYMILVDPSEKRILMFEKNGDLKTQIISSRLIAPRDVVADEKNKRILVIDSNRLLLLPMP